MFIFLADFFTLGVLNFNLKVFFASSQIVSAKICSFFQYSPHHKFYEQVFAGILWSGDQIVWDILYVGQELYGGVA